MGKQLHVKNHYVPEFYLHNWDDENGEICVYNNLVSHKNVPVFQTKTAGSIAYIQHLYTNRIDKVDHDNFELWIEREIESPYKVTQDKIFNGVKLGYDDYQNISRFVLAQYLRVPKFYGTKFTDTTKNMQIFLKRTMEDILRDVEKRIRFKASLTPPETQKLIEEIPLNISYDKVGEDGIMKAETLLGRKAWMVAIQRLTVKHIDKLRNYKWQIIESIDGYEWYTSDNPVTLLNYYSQHKYDFNGLWTKKHTNVFMPISPKYLLFTEVGSRMPIENNVTIQNFLNKCIVENSFLQVYSTKPNNEIKKIRRRTINADEYKRIHDMLSDWHSTQSEGEDAFITNN